MLRWTVFVCVCVVPCRRARWLCQVQMTKIKCYDITTPHQAAVAVCVCVSVTVCWWTNQKVGVTQGLAAPVSSSASL